MADTRNDPLPVFCFFVDLDIKQVGSAKAFFKSVGGLRMETEVVPVREGGSNNTTFQLVGATKWSNIVLKQGFTASSGLIQWRQQWLQGTMKRIAKGTITQLDTAGKPQCSWDFFNAWPCKWEISDFDASKSELGIESLELAHEGIVFNATASAPVK